MTNLYAIYMTWFVATWGNAIYNSSLAYVAARFPDSASQVGWVATCPYVIATVLVVPVGEFSDLVGRKTVVSTCLLLTLVGGIVSGTAQSFGALIAGQGLQGFGLVLCYFPAPLSQEMLPKSARPVVSGIGGCVPGFAFIIAPIVERTFIKKGYGGALDGWRCGYYLSCEFYLLGLISVILFYHPAPRPNPTHRTKLQRLLKIDWLGLLLLAAGLAMFLVALSAGGVTGPWRSAAVISLLALGGLCLGALGLWNWKGTSEGILPHCLFVHRNFGISLAVRTVGSLAQIGCQAYLPQLIVLVYTSDGVLQAVWQLPFTIALICGGLMSGIGLKLSKEARWLAILSMCLLILGSGLLVLEDPNVKFVEWFFPTAIVGLGIGCEAQIMNIVAGLCTPDHLIGTTIMVASLFGTFGGSIGTTIFGQIYQSKLKEVFALFAAIATRSPAVLEKVPGITPALLQAVNNATKSTYAYSFHNVWYTLIAFATITAVASCFILSTRAQLTNVVAAPVGDKIIGLELERKEEGV